jgi:hypothetical protein
MSTEPLHVKAEGWNHYIARQVGYRWPPICRDWFPNAGEESVAWHWKFFQYVFPLKDPRAFPALPNPDWSNDGRRTLDRYVSHIRDLANATVLTAKNGYHVYMATVDSEPEITETVSARDVTVGFLTMFRQCYAAGEEASFTRVSGLLARELTRRKMDIGPLKAWRRAEGTLRHTHLDHLILCQAAADGLVPQHLAEDDASHPDRAASPQQMIATVFYGDTIHWGDQRSAIEAWSAESPVIAVKRRFDALRAAVQLGHFYVGFGAVVGRATGALAVHEI